MSEKTTQEIEAQDAAERLSDLFSVCNPYGTGGHTWNLDTGKCQVCGYPYPYAAKGAVSQ